MTEGSTPYTGAAGTAGGAGVPGRPPTYPPTVTQDQPESKKEQARQSAEHVAGEAKESGRRVASTAQEHAGETAQAAKETVSATAHEAKAQVSNLLSQSMSELSEQAGTQQQRLAGGLTSASSELRQMAESSSEQGLATDLVRRLAEYADQCGRWLEDREPRDVLDDVSAYARRHPGSFLAIAAGLGVLAGRLTRGAKDASASSGQGGPGHAATSATVYEPPAVGATSVAGTTGTVPPPPVPPSSGAVSGGGVPPTTPTSPGGRATGGAGGGVLP